MKENQLRTDVRHVQLHRQRAHNELTRLDISKQTEGCY